MPLSVVIFGPLLAVAVQGAVRFQTRLFAFHREQDLSPGLRVVVVGAGETGAGVLREMRQNRRLGFVPVGVLDDDPTLHHRALHGVPILGGIDLLHDLIEQDDVHLVLLAIRSADAEVARRVADGTNGSGVPVRIVRGAHYWVHGAPLQHLRDLRIEDLLGRTQVELDDEPLRRLLQGRRVLVTGGGGWIGAEIARQVAGFGPSSLTLLDHDETHLHDASYDVPGVVPILADVRDAQQMDRVFADVRPDVVFHAAAHKHVPILEQHACEAARTNVLGTFNVVRAAARHGVQHFVGISTDKAAQPTNVMGASKWLAEQIVLGCAPPDLPFTSVRFGNVLASRGSVVPTFERQIKAGGPVTVTDPEMTRYFMSVDEAVRFVLHAATLAREGGVLALDMGERVNIYELAERMIRLAGFRAGHDIEIRITGPRPGENTDESIMGTDEASLACTDERVIAIAPTRLDADVLDETIEHLREIVAAGDDERARAVLLGVAASVHIHA